MTNTSTALTVATALPAAFAAPRAAAAPDRVMLGPSAANSGPSGRPQADTRPVSGPGSVAATGPRSVDSTIRQAPPVRTATRVMKRTSGRGARRTVMLERSWTWQDQAACQDEPVDLFFGPENEKPIEREDRERRALEVCDRCPVLEACQAHAMGLPEAYGVWGGTTEASRGALRRKSTRGVLRQPRRRSLVGTW